MKLFIVMMAWYVVFFGMAIGFPHYAMKKLNNENETWEYRKKRDTRFIVFYFVTMFALVAFPAVYLIITGGS